MPNITGAIARIVALERRLRPLREGAAGQVLTKLSEQDGDYGWSSGIPGSGQGTVVVDCGGPAAGGVTVIDAGEVA